MPRVPRDLQFHLVADPDDVDVGVEDASLELGGETFDGEILEPWSYWGGTGKSWGEIETETGGVVGAAEADEEASAAETCVIWILS